jgi:serine/threonine-protein kinase RsbW
MIKIKKESAGHLRIMCSSEFDHLDRIVDETEQFLAGLLTNEDLAYRVVLLLTEATTNAIEHGNANDATKKVLIDLVVRDHEVTVHVEDEGSGFDRGEVQNPTTSENLMNDGGRGIFFIEQMADQVAYELDGRKVCILFHRTPT